MTQPCPECGQPVRADQPLCAHCGRQLGGAGAPRGGEPSSGGPSAGGSPADDASSIRRDKERDLAFLGKIVAGKYRVLKVLGQGGFGSVFLVEVVEGIVGDRLAIKILPQEFGSRPHLQEQFLNEIRVAMRMVNKYIVQIRDVGVTEEGLLYYTMDYVPGKTLSQIIREEGRIAPQRAIRIVMRVLNALMTAHSARIIHRDLKPANVMILGSGPRETVRVLDFGIARALVSEDRETKGFTGSPFYMPPEQFLGTELGFYTDLYSVGVILYECLTGEKPYRGSTPQDVYNSLKSGPPTPVEELAPEVRNFPGLAEVVARAMERNPEKRFQTAKEFFEVLHAVRSGEIDADTPTRPIAFPTPAKAAKPPAAPRIPKRRTVEKAKRTSRQSTLITIIILLGVIALAAILASEFLGKYREENREGGGKTAETSSAKGGLSQPGPTQPAPGPSQPAVVPGPEIPEPPPPGPTPVARTLEELLADAERALREQNWPAAADLADDVLHEKPEHPRALAIRGEATFRLGDFDAAAQILSDLERISPQSLDPSLSILLAEAFLQLRKRSADPHKAEEVLRAARGRHPQNVEIAVRLARLLLELDRQMELKQLVVEARAQGLRHSELDELYKTLVEEPAAKLAEEIRALEEQALAAYRKIDHAAAIAPAESALKRAASAAPPADSACMRFILADAYGRVGRLDTSDATIEKLSALAASGTGMPAGGECLPWLTAESLPLWADFFSARNAYSRYLLDRKSELIQAAEAGLDGILRRVDLKSAPELAALASAYQGMIRAHFASDPKEISAVLSMISGVRDSEILLLEAEAYHIFGRRIETLDAERLAALERRIEDLKRDVKNLTAEEERAESTQDRKKARTSLDQATKELAESLQAKKDDDASRKIKTEAFQLANKQLYRLLNNRDVPPPLLRRTYFLLGEGHLELGKLGGGYTQYRSAANNFSEAIKAGLESLQLHETYAECLFLQVRYLDAAVHYEAAYGMEPTESRCLAAAESYKRVPRKLDAIRILEDGRQRFPQSDEIRRKLVEVQR